MMSLDIDTEVEKSSEIPHHSRGDSWRYLLDFFPDQRNYEDDVCTLILSNSPKDRNRMAQDLVTVRAKEYRRGERWYA